MIRSIVMITLATLVFVADVSAGAVGRQIIETGSKDAKDAKPLPPGPHFILTVPIVLSGLPPEVDQYRVRCTVMSRSGREGHGSATGAIAKPAGAEKMAGVDIKTEATVGIFFTSGTLETLESAGAYRCSLYLHGTSYEVTTTYLDDRGLPYQNGESGFPLASGAPFKRFFRGHIPR